MRLPQAALGAAVAVTVAGCAGDERADPPREGAPPPPAGGDEAVIRGWNRAVNRGRYGRAAGYFARGAVVEQVITIRLRTRDDAVAFNSGLPCRARITDIELEAASTLVAFDLREGRTGECRDGGAARVRFVIEDGAITEWRQLPTPSQPRGDIA